MRQRGPRCRWSQLFIQPYLMGSHLRQHKSHFISHNYLTLFLHLTPPSQNTLIVFSVAVPIRSNPGQAVLQHDEPWGFKPGIPVQCF